MQPGTDTRERTEAPATAVPEVAPTGMVALLRRQVRQNLRQYGMLFALAVILVLFAVATDGVVVQPLNVTNLVAQNSYLLILAIGMVIVIVSGHIDLSVGSVAAFVGAVAAVLMVRHDIPFPLALVLCLLLGAAIGAWQGFWVAYVGIPSFIVTLAGMLLFRGATQITLEGRSIAPFPESFQDMSTGFLPAWGPDTDYHNLTLLIGAVVAVVAVVQESRDRRARQRYGFDALPRAFFLAKCGGIVTFVVLFTLTLASYRGIPVVLIILLALIAAYSFVMRSTVTGRHVYATGGNEPAARLSGIRSSRVTFLAFTNMGVLAALAGLVYAARLNAGTPQAGELFELEAIAAAFIGGASMSGGVGTVVGAVIGGLVLGVLNNGMSLLGIGVDVQQVIKGLVLLLAVAFDIWNKKRVGS